MAKNSAIEWTHHTFNPWWGCTKVSPGCKHCYAEAFSRRLGERIWGQRTDRRYFGEAHWREPLKWNKEAVASGQRRRVFCASMADVFEHKKELQSLRERLWSLIEVTPALDWLLLTKRPERVRKDVPWTADWPKNVWIGTTAENQTWANKRIPLLLEVPAIVRFLSCEPLLGPLDLSHWMKGSQSINWVIAGGESGNKARPMNPEWARSLRDQCERAGVPFHFKQWGHWAPVSQSNLKVSTIEVTDSRGRAISLARLGKRASGRTLDGMTWDGFPHPIG